MNSPGTGTATDLETSVRRALRAAVEIYGGDPDVAAAMREHLTRFDEPLRIAIAGKVKAGKSTLLNALVGERVAPTDSGECTRVVTWYEHGVSPRIRLHLRDGPSRGLPVRRVAGRLVMDLDGHSHDDVERLVVRWPVRTLESETLIDTPGIDSLSTTVSERTHAFLTPQDEPSAADAIIYLLRHLHSSDLDFLESFHDQTAGSATMTNAIGILSRADEIGAGRLDALISARRVARRYSADPMLRQLCQTVVPVAGLLAETSRTLRQDEYLLLEALAELPKAQTEDMLLSVDRFIRTAVTGGPAPDVRMALLDRFGLFGVRLSLVLLRAGLADASALAEELLNRSGLGAVRQLLANQFAERRTVLKARSAVLAMERTVRAHPMRRAQGLSDAVQRILAGAHEFRELQLLRVLRLPELELSPDAAREAERLLGGSGTSRYRRCGVPEDATAAEIRSVARDAIRRWRVRAESPLSDRVVADASRVVVRSCEGILAQCS